MCHSISNLVIQFSKRSNHYDTLMPLCIKNTLQKIIILDITPTFVNWICSHGIISSWWTITFNLNYLNYHYISDTSWHICDIKFYKSPLVTSFLPLAFEYNYVDILIRVCSISTVEKEHKFAAFLRFYKRFFTLIHIKDWCKIILKIATIQLLHWWLTRIDCRNS